MPKTKQLRPTAILLVSIYLFLSGFMAIGAVQHDLIHEHHADHSKQHTSLACDWMCTASAFLHPIGPTFTHSFNFSLETKVVYVEHFNKSLLVFSLHTRPPPFSLS